MDLQSRHRINATLRMGTQKQASKNLNKNNLLELEVIIPHTLQKQSPPKIDPLLRPLQTNTRLKRIQKEHGMEPNIQAMPQIDPLKKPSRSTRKEYKLVEDKDIPNELKDTRHQIVYQKLNCLGSGAFAKVYRIKSRDKYHAAKIVSKESLRPENIKKKLFAEINIHRVLKHDYIVNFESCFEDKHNIYLVLELCKNGTLSNMLRARKVLTEYEVRYYMGQILSALRYMSDNRILHRDLKLGNILLDENMDCKLGDFGLAALLVNKEDRKRTICGTPHYIAPEILFNEGHDHRADMWSAGILMFNLLYGKHPFHHDEHSKLYEQVRQNENHAYTFPTKYTGFEPVSEDAKDLIQKLLVNDPDERLCVIEALKHDFFSKYKIPLRIPKTALFKKPEYFELFEQESLGQHTISKVDDAIRRAKNIAESQVDYNINPPLKIMKNVILDPRTQYPIRVNSSQPSNLSIIPSQSEHDISSKKRIRSTPMNHNSTKRLCSSSTTTTNVPIETISTKTVNQSNKTTHMKPIESSSNISSSTHVKLVESCNISTTVKSSKIDSQKKQKEIILPDVENLTVSDGLAVNNNNTFAVPSPVINRNPIMEEMAGNLKVMIDRRSDILPSQRTNRITENNDFNWCKGNVFVQNWIDCTPCYGFTYRLSDGTMGVLYNDGSTMTSVDNQNFYYIYYRYEDGKYIESIYNHEVPDELKKKQDLLNAFKRYTVGFLPLEFSVTQATEITKIHLFKYMISDTCITFRLNNGVIQFNFFKSGKLILYEKAQKMIYIDTSRKMHHFNTIDVLKSNDKEMVEALYSAFKVLEEQNKQRMNALRNIRWQRMEKEYTT